RTAVFCRSEYEWAVHARIGRQVGLTDADAARVLAGPGHAAGADLETALLRAVDELHRDHVLGEETWALLAAELDERQILDAIATVGAYRSAAYAINSAGISSTTAWRSCASRRRCAERRPGRCLPRARLA